MPSGLPQVTMTTAPPGLVTRCASPSPTAGLPAYWNESKPVTMRRRLSVCSVRGYGGRQGRTLSVPWQSAAADSTDASATAACIRTAAGQGFDHAAGAALQRCAHALYLACRGDLVVRDQARPAFCASLRCSNRITGTSTSPSWRAASSRPWPAGNAALVVDQYTLSATKGVCYICMSSSEIHTLQRPFTAAGGKRSTFVIWAKNTFAPGRVDYQRQYEPILYCWRDEADHYWCAARDQGRRGASATG
jgi:hypothetical protein